MSMWCTPFSPMVQNVVKGNKNGPGNGRENDPPPNRRCSVRAPPDSTHCQFGLSLTAMAPKKPAENHNSEGEGGTPSPGIIGGAALIGAAAGLAISGPLVGVALGGAAALTTLRKDQVGFGSKGFLRGCPRVGCSFSWPSCYRRR